MEEMKRQVLEAMEALDDVALNAGVLALVREGASSNEIEALLQCGIRQVEKKFEQGTYFLADLIVSGMMFRSALELLPIVGAKDCEGKSEGKVLIGVVAGDIHDIGKDIVAQILKTERFEILDLGVDVPAEEFVRRAEEYKPDIIALSGVMGTSSAEMKRVIDALGKSGIHPFTPVIVGGSCVSELVRERIGADEYAKGPVDTMLFCKTVMENKNEKR